MSVGVSECVCECVRVCACVRVCVRGWAGMSVSVRACACVYWGGGRVACVCVYVCVVFTFIAYSY